MAHLVLKRYWARIPAVSDVCHRGCAYRIHLPYNKAWLIEVADQGLRSREAKPCCREDYGIELLTIQMPGVCSAAYRTLGINDHLKCFDKSRTYTRLRASFCATLPQRAERRYPLIILVSLRPGFPLGKFIYSFRFMSRVPSPVSIDQALRHHFIH